MLHAVVTRPSASVILHFWNFWTWLLFSVDSFRVL